MKTQININGQAVGDGCPPYIIAEVSCNHMGNLETAKALIDAAADAGVDAVKLQTYEADTITLDGPQEHFKLQHPLWNNMTYHQLYKKAQTPFSWMEPLFKHARMRGITIFSAPFDISAADLLIELDAPIFKIASFEAVHIPLIKKLAATGKPLIISTGIASEAEINSAVVAAREAGCNDLILMHCVSAYPTPLEQAQLIKVQLLRDSFGVLVGLSDHSKTTLTAEVAVGLGACMVEKHIMLRKDDDTFDKEFSLVPDEFAELVKRCKAQTPDNFRRQKRDPTVVKAIGEPTFKRQKGEKDGKPLRPSILVAKDIKKGEVFTADNLVIRRPAVGLAPKHWEDVIGKRADKDLSFGDALNWRVIQK